VAQVSATGWLVSPEPEGEGVMLSFGRFDAEIPLGEPVSAAEVAAISCVSSPALPANEEK
jgi:hypothetical protein